MRHLIHSALAVAMTSGIGLAVSSVSASAQLTAQAPDLVPLPNRMLNGTVSVRNAGSGDASSFVVTVQCQKQGGGGCAEHPGLRAYSDPKYPGRLVVPVSGLEKGKVFNLALPFWSELDWQPGNYNFLLEADAGKTVGETNEGNNLGGAVLSK